MKKNTLSLELIPKKMWGKNVRAVISRENWDALRWSFGATTTKPQFIKIKVSEPDRKPLECKICSVRKNNLELHELWQYDDKKLIQKLVGLIPVCENCHLSMHLGRATQLGLAQRVKKHIAKTNQWTESQVTKHIEESFKKWRLRSHNDYQLNFDWLTHWIPKSKIHLHWLEKSKRWSGDRLDAIAWAQETLNSNAVIVDTETTGLLTYEKVEVIELAVISMQEETIYESRFKPHYKIPKRTTDIHGITNDDVKKEPKFKDEYLNILEALNSKVVIAYKADFDMGVIKRTCERYDLPPPECRWECAMHAYRAFQESGPRLPLPNSKHNALGDCRAVLDLIKKMAKC